MKQYLLLLILFWMSVVGCQQNRETQGQETAVSTAIASTPTAQSSQPAPTGGTTILAEGHLVAVNPTLALAFETNGRLLSIAVKPGDVVAAGDLIATLDDKTLQGNITSAELQVAQAENSLAQAQTSLDELLNWQPNETAVLVAQANLAAAQASYENAQTQDAAAGNSLTSASISVEQAERNLTDAQEAYNTAFDPGREWELNDPFRADALKAEREGAIRSLAYAEENLQVAQAQYNLAWAGLNNDTALNAQASVASAQQTLEQAQTGPKEAEIAAAELQVAQAELSLAQSQFTLGQAQAALEQTRLVAPWAGTVVSVETAVGAIVGAGTPIVTLLDTVHLEFHTTNVSERDLAQITSGGVAEIVLKSYPEATLNGTVADIAPQSSGTVGDAAVFTVMISLEQTELVLRPGMTGRVEIVGGEP